VLGAGWCPAHDGNRQVINAAANAGYPAVSAWNGEERVQVASGAAAWSAAATRVLTSRMDTLVRNLLDRLDRAAGLAQSGATLCDVRGCRQPAEGPDAFGYLCWCARHAHHRAFCDLAHTLRYPTLALPGLEGSGLMQPWFDFARTASSVEIAEATKRLRLLQEGTAA
jgi:hypothetical protein